MIGMYQVPSIDSKTLAEVAKDALCRCNLPLSKLRGQCHDGASAMCGAKSGVAARILAEEDRTLSTHTATATPSTSLLVMPLGAQT